MDSRQDKPQRGTDAAIYREAARLMEQGTYDSLTKDSCCWAIALHKNPGIGSLPMEGDPHSRRMKAVFAPRGQAYWLHDKEYFHTDPRQTPHRILALCFMAAMVEAGDA